MTLELVDYINGISSLIYVTITIIVGMRIALKYLKLGDKNFLYIGIAIMGLSEPWLPSGISFLSNLIYERGLALEIYVIIGNIFIPVTLLLWLIGFANLIIPDKKMLIGITYGIIGILFEIIFFMFLIIDPSLIGTFSEESLVRIDIEYKAFNLLYLMLVVGTILITGMLFSQKSLKSKSPEIKFKGIFLLLAPLVWGIGAIFDSAIPLNLYTLPITRILLAFSAFFYYLGFIFPSGIKKYLSKK